MTSSSTAAPITRALLAATLILGASAAIALASPAYVSNDLARRLWGVLLGVVVVVYANAAPKTLTPLARMRCEPAAEQALRRFCGRALVVGGLGYAAAWLFAPLESAWTLAVACLAGALLLVVLRWAWTIGTRR